MKKFVALLLAMILVLSVNPVTAMAVSILNDEQALFTKGEYTSQYSDVAENDHFAFAANDLAKMGINVGKTEDIFSPNDSFSAVELITLMYQMDGSPTGIETVLSSDISNDDPNYAALNWAAYNQITESIPTTALVLDKAANREDMAILLYRYAGYSNANATYNQYLDNYADGNLISDYAVAAMNWAISGGIIKGNDAGELEPMAPVSRADVSIFLWRYFRNVVNGPDDDFENDYGIRIEFPSEAQKTIERGRDFYIIGEFTGNVNIPDDAFVRVELMEITTSIVHRTVFSSKKNDYDSLDVDYQYLNIWSGQGDKETFKKSGMPDLVYNKNIPGSFNNTWNKCFYSDERFNCAIFGGAYTRDVNMMDQFGGKMDILPAGNYQIHVLVITADGKDVVAYAVDKMVIGTYPNKTVSPFQPDEHFDRLKEWAAEKEYEVFLDPFPGYWNCEFINPEWHEDYYGTITAKWKYMDATEYNTGNIHLGIYNIGTKSTSFNVELGEIQSKDGNLNRLSCYYYDLGEPSLHKGSLQSSFVKMNSLVEFTRADYLTTATTMGNNHVDMRTLDTVDIYKISGTAGIPCNPGQVVAIYGVCQPIMSVGKIEMDPTTSTFTLNNRIEKIIYTFIPAKGVPLTYVKDVLLVRENATTNLEAKEGIFEFKHDFIIPNEWGGETVAVTYSAIDSFGNVVVAGEMGPSLAVHN